MSHVVTDCIRAENEQNVIFRHVGPHQMSSLGGLTLGQLRYHVNEAPRQPNAPPHCHHKVYIHRNNNTLSVFLFLSICTRELILVNHSR